MHRSGLFFFIGFMGCGKSYWAKRMSQKMGVPHVDLDRQIEAKKGDKILEIFSRDGESVFRRMEREALHELNRHSFQGIVACGGGTPCFFDNIAWMKQQGIVVFLKASLHTLEQRIGELPNRPLIQQHQANWAELKMLYESRLAFYEQADMVVEVDTLDDTIFAEILLPYV